MSNTITDTVNNLEHDLDEARFANEQLVREKTILEVELTMLRSQNVKLQSERDEALTTAAALDTLMEQVSGGLISGIHKARSLRRMRQERALGVNDEGDKTPYHTEAAQIEPPVTRTDDDTDRVRRPAPVAPLTPEPAPVPRFLRTPQGRVNNNLADLDSRLPRVDYKPDTRASDGALAEMALRMTK